MEFRPPTHDDVSDIVAMLLACDVADFGMPDYDREALLAEWAQPGIDLERDAFLTEGAYGLLDGSMARAWVHPERLGQGLGTALADRLEARARERGLEFVDQQPARRNVAARVLLEQRGYSHVRAIAELRLDAVEVEELPDGAVRSYDPARDEAALQSLLERALAGGIGRLLPLEGVLAANPDTSLWFCVDAPDRSLAGGIRAELRPAGFITGYVTQVAVEEAHRRQGIGSRLVGVAARELADRGVDTIRLAVRSDNPVGRAFFDHLGFSGHWQVDELRLPLGPVYRGANFS